MSDKTPNHVWARYAVADDDHRRRLLITARKAVNTEPGAVPEVWPLYTGAQRDGISAEHPVIGIWATHQQGDGRPVHAARTDDHPFPPNFGHACRELFAGQHASSTVRSPLDTFAEDTITKRLAVLSRTDEVTIAAAHITSLIRLMRSAGHIVFNYDDLLRAIRHWSDQERRTAVLYRWSQSYFYVPHTKTETGRKGRKEGK